MNEASKTLEFPPPPTPSSHPFSWRFPLLTLTHTLQSFRGTAWRLHIHTSTRLERHGKTTSPLCDDISVFGRSSPTAAALLGWVCVWERARLRLIMTLMGELAMCECLEWGTDLVWDKVPKMLLGDIIKKYLHLKRCLHVLLYLRLRTLYKVGACSCFGIFHPKMIIYSPSCCSKPVRLYFLCGTQRKIF